MNFYKLELERGVSIDMERVKLPFDSAGEIWGGIKWVNLTNERLQNDKSLEIYGYKVNSQNDEDGIIEEIFNRIGTTNKVFIEFGVQDGLESNTHYLLFKDWKGLWIEGDENFVCEINKRFKPVIKSGQLKVLNAFITKDNINELFESQQIKGEIDLLSIDIDRNDYYIFDSVSVVNPRVIIVEYNGKIPPNCEWIMPYNEYHIWDGTDKHSASLKSYELLGREKAYQLVGTNINGVNAFFVRQDLVHNLFIEPATSEYLYNPLRLYLKHSSGLPAKNCLCSKKKGMEGVFDFVDENLIVSYGFHEEEILEDNTRMRWMKDKKARIFVKPLIQPVNYIILHYKNLLPKKKLIITVCIEDSREQQFNIEDSSGCLQIYVDDEFKIKEVIMLDIKTNCLWVPAEILGTTDERTLGIAIELNTIEYIENTGVGK